LDPRCLIKPAFPDKSFGSTSIPSNIRIICGQFFKIFTSIELEGFNNLDDTRNQRLVAINKSIICDEKIDLKRDKVGHKQKK